MDSASGHTHEKSPGHEALYRALLRCNYPLASLSGSLPSLATTLSRPLPRFPVGWSISAITYRHGINTETEPIQVNALWLHQLLGNV